MGLTLTVDCSYHQKDDDARQEEIDLETIDIRTATQVEKELKSRGWVVQFNGDNMDTYCSKKCAK